MRLAAVGLSRPDLTIPVPGTSSLLTPGRVVDVETPYWASLLAEGSIVELTDAAAPTDPAPVSTQPDTED